jgi:hypothetical protein
MGRAASAGLPTSSPCELETRMGGRVFAVDGMRGQVLAVAAELLERSGEAHLLPSVRVGAKTTAERIARGPKPFRMRANTGIGAPGIEHPCSGPLARDGRATGSATT